MNKRQRMRFMWAMLAAVVGTSCFVATLPRFDLIPTNVGRTVGIVFFLISGVLWANFGLAPAKEE